MRGLRKRKENKMKRFTAILLVLLLALSLAACGQKATEQNATVQNAPAPTAAPEATVEPTATPEPTPTPIPADLLPVIKILDERSPEQLVQGRKFGVRGIVYTEKGVLTEVFAKVNDADGNTVLSSNTYKPNEARIDLHSSVNNDLSFGKLEAGTYTYIVTATANNDGAIVKTDVVKRVFTVSTDGAAQVAAGGNPAPAEGDALADYVGSYVIFAPEGMTGTLELRKDGGSYPFTLNIPDRAHVEGSASLGAAYQAVLSGKDVNDSAVKAELVSGDYNTWKLLVTESEWTLLPAGTELVLARSGGEPGSVIGNVVDYFVGNYNSADGAAKLELGKNDTGYPFTLSVVNLTRIEGMASDAGGNKTLLEGKDANGNPIKAELAYAGDGEYTLTFTDSQWNLLPNGTEMRFVNPDAPNGPNIPVVPEPVEEQPAEGEEPEQTVPQTPAPTVKPTPQKGEKSGPSVGLIALIIVLLLAAAAAGYLFYRKKAAPEETYQGRH